MYKKVYTSSKVNITEEDILRHKALKRAEFKRKHQVKHSTFIAIVFGKEVEVTEEDLPHYEGFTIRVKL